MAGNVGATRIMIKVMTTIAVHSTMFDKIDNDDGNTLIRLIMMMEIL